MKIAFLGRGETPPFFRSKACGVRADVGSELSAAGGRGSEVSEWPRSKFPASAVRQRRNFGHRNRIIGPYGCVTRSAVQWAVGDADPYGTVCRGGRPCPPGPITQRLVGQGPCALPVRRKKRIPRSRLCRDLGDGGCGLPRARCALAMTYLCTLCTHHIHHYLYIGKNGRSKRFAEGGF